MSASAKEKDVDLSDAVWTLAHVAKRLNCSKEHAARWLRDNDVDLTDIGLGKRQIIRVDPRQVQGAIESGKVRRAVTIGSKQRSISYVPRYPTPERWQSWQGN